MKNKDFLGVLVLVMTAAWLGAKIVDGSVNSIAMLLVGAMMFTAGSIFERRQ